MLENSATKFVENITENRLKSQVRFPGDEDLSGAATALLRLQDVYNLDPHDLMNGLIRGEKVGEKLTAQDAFEVGKSAYNQRDYYHCLQWMQASLNRVSIYCSH